MPVAILGTTDVDVTEVDPDSVALEGVAPLRFNYKDVAAASNCHGSSDGFVDLALRFDSTAIGAVVASAQRGDQRTLELTGKLLLIAETRHASASTQGSEQYTAGLL